MSRIVAGSVGGAPLRVPSSGTRPTSERVREALFSKLETYQALQGGRVVDLCAGSGALGLEAASRGASEVALVDYARGAIKACQDNVRRLGLRGVRVVMAKAQAYTAGPAGSPVDLVFFDPPYDMSEASVSEVLTPLVRSQDPWLQPHSVVVVERSTRSPEPTWPAGMHSFTDKKYGETRLWFAELD